MRDLDAEGQEGIAIVVTDSITGQQTVVLIDTFDSIQIDIQVTEDIVLRYTILSETDLNNNNTHTVQIP